MDAKDVAFVDALFGELQNPAYSPILIYTKTYDSEKYIQEKISRYGVTAISSLEEFEDYKFKDVVALMSLEQAEQLSVVQESLSALLDRCRDNNQTIILTSHKNINEMRLIGILRARLLCGVYVEL